MTLRPIFRPLAERRDFRARTPRRTRHHWQPPWPGIHASLAWASPIRTSPSTNAPAARQILFIPILRSLPERVHPSPLLWGIGPSVNNDHDATRAPIPGRAWWIRYAEWHVTDHSPHRARHGGHDYFFCSAGCRTKFIADPARMWTPQRTTRRARTVTPLAATTIYTCPMHPQIRQAGPGTCPICGMALEPLMPTASRRRFRAASRQAQVLDRRRAQRSRGRDRHAAAPAGPAPVRWHARGCCGTPSCC